MNYVYWIYNSDCKDLNDGYIGVTKDPHTRFKSHVRKNRVPLDSKYKIIFEGSREECFQLEKQLRPTSKIGWNNAVGGSHGWRSGFSHSNETKQLLKEKWTDERKLIASSRRKQQNKNMIGQKRPKQSIAMSGEKNPMYGKTMPNHVKEAIIKANKNRKPVNKQDNYCEHCGKRVSISIMKKYHGIGRKNCVK
jgi:predicted GIY-YIG superfamily endonuclease